MAARFARPCVFSIVCFLTATAGAQGSVASDILALTGGRRVRIAWSSEKRILVFDTDEGRERELVSEPFTLDRTLITYDGSRVVYSSGQARKTFAVNWDGSGRRQWAAGYTTCLWYDKVTGTQYAILGGTVSHGSHQGGPLWKVELDDPSKKEKIWDKQSCTIANVTITDDGTKLGGGFPWHSAEVVLLPGQEKHTHAHGCFAEISPTEDIVATFSSGHARWDFKDFRYDGGAEKWEFRNHRKVLMSGMHKDPRRAQEGVFNPFWSNLTDFLVTAGGRRQKESVFLYFGKLDRQRTRIERWVRVSSTPHAAYGSAWIDLGIDPKKPRLALSASGLSFTADALRQGGGDPAGRTVAIRNLGAGTLGKVRISEGASWLKVTVSGTGNSQRLANAVTIKGLAAGTYAEDVKVSAGNAANSPLVYQVTLKVYGPPELTTIEMTPSRKWVAPGEPVDLTARPLDQKGNPIRMSTREAGPPRRASDADIKWSVDGGGSISPRTGTRVRFTPPPGARKDFTITASSGNVKGAATVSTVVHIKINCGFNNLTPPGWEDDEGYVTGGNDNSDQYNRKWDTGAPNAAPADVYKSGREQSHTFDFPELPNGAYTVRFHFGITGGKEWAYVIEGRDVPFNLDAGSAYAWVVKDFPVTVSDGNGLQIKSKWVKGRHPYTAGVEVISQGEAPPSEPTITLTRPNGGEVWEIGTTRYIEWTVEEIKDARIILSTNNGKDWVEIVQSVDTKSKYWRRYPWKVGCKSESADASGEPKWQPLEGDIASKRCLIFIQDYFGEHEHDTSDGPFEIRKPAPGPAREGAGREKPETRPAERKTEAAKLLGMAKNHVRNGMYAPARSRAAEAARGLPRGASQAGEARRLLEARLFPALEVDGGRPGRSGA